MHLHKRFTTEQVVRILDDFNRKLVTEIDGLRFLGIGHTQFFKLLKRWRSNPQDFSLVYQRSSPKQLSSSAEATILIALKADHDLVVDKSIPINHYNYSAIRDEVVNKGFPVSLPTIIDRAKQYGWYQPRPKKRSEHTHQVMTIAPGALIQHDSSYYQWSPLVSAKWHLITSLDDYSRLLLYATLVDMKTTWTHIEAVKFVTLTYGVPLEWYTDQLRIFRFVAHGQSMWINQSLHTDNVNPQWKQCVLASGAGVIHALSLQAKGKIERPYQWLQDRVVRQCIKHNITDIRDANQIVATEVERYNTHQVHSTTKSIPIMRFSQATKEGKSLFKPFQVKSPYVHLDDISCLTETRTTNTYRKIQLWNTEIQLPKVPKCEPVIIHLAPYRERQTIHIRVWYNNTLVYRAHHHRNQFPKVHF